MQGQAFLVTFAAIGKSDWPRAAIEREGGMRLWFDKLTTNGGMQSSSFQRPLTLTLSREGRGDNTGRRVGRDVFL